jgi:hypothetical protein
MCGHATGWLRFAYVNASQAGVKKAKPDKSRKKAKRQPEWLRKLGEN